MNVSDWIALGALAVAAVSPTVAMLRGSGRHEGKVDAALEQTARILSDHEERLRKGGL